MRISQTLIATALLLTQIGGANAGALAVEIGDGIRPGEQVLVTIYDQEAAWLTKPLRALKQTAAADPSRPGTHIASFEALPAGRYAVVVYVDRNANGKLDRGMFGRPTEPFGFSNGGGSFGPPDYADAAFELAESGSTIRIDLN